MKKLYLFSALVCSLLSLTSSAESTYQYKQEFEAFKNSPRYEAIFNEEAPRVLSDLQATIEIDKNLTSFQRFVRSFLFLLHPVTMSAETMPKLYGYVDALCKEQHITTPTIFVTRDISSKEGFFNALAQKFFMSSGAIMVGQKLLLETTDAELEAVIAHEIGHIKYNHVNKHLLINLLSLALLYPILNKLLYKPNSGFDAFTRGYIIGSLGGTVGSMIINKRFEKQADEFAYKVAGKGEGCIEFFEHLKKRKQAYDDYYPKTYAILQESKKDLSFDDGLSLSIDYYLASFGHKLNNLCEWLYYNTFLGAHPSPDARIDAVKKYLASQE